MRWYGERRLCVVIVIVRVVGIRLRVCITVRVRIGIGILVVGHSNIDVGVNRGMVLDLWNATWRRGSGSRGRGRLAVGVDGHVVVGEVTQGRGEVVAVGGAVLRRRHS